MQGNLSQNARDEVMDSFRNGRVRILLATNVAARGLDMSHVEQVINVELPESPQLLTHRIGRTGRMGRQGMAITLLGREDNAKWRQLERGLGRHIERKPWPGAAAALADDGQILPIETAVPHDPPHKPATHDRAVVVHSDGRRRAPRPQRTEPKASTWDGNPLPFVASVEEAPVEKAAASTGGRRDDSQRSRRNRPESNGNRPESNGNRKDAATVEVDADGNRWDYDSRVERDRRRQSHNGIRPIAPTMYASRTAPGATPSNDRPQRDPQASRPQRTESGQQSNGNGNNNRRASSNGDGAGERHDIECAACGITTSVPFKPDSGRPVYCRDCYNAMRPEGTTGNRNRSSRNSQSQESRQVQPV